MAWRHEVSWWLGIAVIAIVSVLLFRVLAARLPFAPIQQLAAAV